MANKEPNKNNDDNNFFNKNPLITFAVFSVVMILLFKALVGDGAAMNEGIATQNTRTKAVSYSELKALVASKSLSKVEIGQTYIKARSADGQVYTTRIVRGDSKLIDRKSVV